MRLSGKILLIAAVAIWQVSCLAARVEIDVKGIGWRDDRRIERLLNDIMTTSGDQQPVLDAAVLEDALLILRSEIVRKGFLSSVIRHTLVQDGDAIATGSWDFMTSIPGLPWADADRLVFEVEKGLRSHIKEVHFAGLASIPEEEAREFFIPSGGLLVSRSERAYSPSRLQSGMRLLRQRLGQLGYPGAEVTSRGEPVIAPDGEVAVFIDVVEGPLHVWGSTSVEDGLVAGVEGFGPMPPAGEAFSMEALQDWVSVVRKQFLLAGYPDVNIRVNQETVQNAAVNQAVVNIRLKVSPGPRVRLGKVEFTGLQKTDERFLRLQTRLEPGNWLSRPDVQAAQFRLGQLGIFGRVQTEYTDLSTALDGESRDVRFIVSERKRQTVSLLFGYGSYEQFRIGAEARTLNVFGKAHSAHVRFRQSMKSSAGALYYTVPRPVSWLTSAQLRVQGLLREEVSFDREEALLAFGVERNFLGGAVGTTVEYRYELLQSKGFVSNFIPGDTNTAAGSMNFGFSWDTRDQIVMPKRGASIHGVLELASTVIGSESEFQRFIFRSSYHRPLVDDWLRSHFGLSAGVLSRLGSEPYELPTNKRFFPGGENSNRGYKEGEASPLDSDGVPIGAEAFTLAQAELEASITDSLAVVVFIDVIWNTAYLDQSSDGETLTAAGLGLRYSTPFGPLRLEYGHNLDPRPSDPNGTLHLSIGFPF